MRIIGNVGIGCGEGWWLGDGAPLQLFYILRVPTTYLLFYLYSIERGDGSFIC